LARFRRQGAAGISRQVKNVSVRIIVYIGALSSAKLKQCAAFAIDAPFD